MGLQINKIYRSNPLNHTATREGRGSLPATPTALKGTDAAARLPQKIKLIVTTKRLSK